MAAQSKKVKVKVSELLKNGRINAGLTQRQVSDSLGYGTSQFISNWERGLSRPPVEALKIIIPKYNLNSEQVFDAILSETTEEITDKLRSEFCHAELL